MGDGTHDNTNPDHQITGIPLRQKDAPQFKEEVSVNIGTSRPKSSYGNETNISRLRKCLINPWRDNYTAGIHIDWIVFSLAVIWGSIFCIVHQLGVNAAVLAGFTAITAIIAVIAYEEDKRHIAGITFLFHAVGILLFTMLFVFNPSKEYVALYHSSPSPKVVHYAQEPWVIRHKPEISRNALFFKRNFRTTINKYVDFEKKDMLITFTVDFVLSDEKAKANFASLNKDTMSRDTGAASEIMTRLVLDTVKKVMDDREFLQNIESADTLLYNLPSSERHEIKQKMFRGALENSLRNSQGNTMETLLYVPDPSSAKIIVGSAIYTRPTN